MEELKLIMQTLAGLGETAKEGFIWWMVIDRLVPVLCWAAFGGSLVSLAYYIVKRVVGEFSKEGELKREKEASIATIKVIRGILGVYTFPAAMRDGSWYAQSDLDETVNAVRAVKQAAEKNSGTLQKVTVFTDKAIAAGSGGGGSGGFSAPKGE